MEFCGLEEKRGSRMTARPDLAQSHSKYPPRLTGPSCGPQDRVEVIICTLEGLRSRDQPGKHLPSAHGATKAPLWPGVLRLFQTKSRLCS